MDDNIEVSIDKEPKNYSEVWRSDDGLFKKLTSRNWSAPLPKRNSVIIKEWEDRGWTNVPGFEGKLVFSRPPYYLRYPLNKFPKERKSVWARLRRNLKTILRLQE